MAPQAVTAPLFEVVEAMATFLLACGLKRSASLLRQEAPLAEPGLDLLAEETERLAAVLGTVAAEVTGKGKENVATNEEAWMDDVLAKALASGILRDAGGTNLEQSLQRSLVAKEHVAATEPAAAGYIGSKSEDAVPTATGATAEAEAGEVVAENQVDDSSKILPPPVPAPAPAPEPSLHYDSSKPAPTLADGFKDEYRDDGDPGYRILVVSEIELLAELQDSYQAAVVQAQSSQARPDVCPDAQHLDELDQARPEGVPSEEVSQTDQTVVSQSAGDVSIGSVALDSNEPGIPPHEEQSAEVPASGAGERQAPPEGPDAGASAVDGAIRAPTNEVSLSTAAMAAVAQRGEAQVPLPPAALPGLQIIQPPQLVAAMPQPAAASTRGHKKKSGRRPAYRYAPSGDDFYPAEMDGVVFDSFPLRVVFERDRTGFEQSKEFPIEIGSVIAARYQVLKYLGSAAFSRAVQCLDLEKNEMVCMKIIKNEKDFVDQSLDEIKLLKLINMNTEDIDAKHCVRLLDCFYHREHLILVTELLRENLYEFSKWNREHGEAPYFTLGRLQRVSKQLLVALEYIHGLWLIHSDLKPENILMQSYSRCLVKLIDFGSSCFVDDHLSSYVQSRSYRAPEVLLGLPYGQKIDIWSLGCVLAELWTGYVLFQNDSAQSLLARIMGIVGPFPVSMLSAGKYVPNYFTQDGRLFKELEVPPEVAAEMIQPELVRRIQLLLPKRSSLRQRMRVEDEAFEDFLEFLLRIDPAQRPSASEALQHPWLQEGRYSDGL